MTCLIVGTYYCYDNPAELESIFISELKITEKEYTYLYSIYSAPNIVIPLFTGVLIDRIGLETGLIVVNFLSIAG